MIAAKQIAKATLFGFASDEMAFTSLRAGSNFGDTDLLVRNMEHGRDLAKCLGDANVVLMRGHGCSVVGPNIKGATLGAVYLQVSASVQLQSMPLGEVRYLTEGETEQCTEMFYSDLAVDRAWENLATRVTKKS